MNEEICYADATELARRIRDKELSPVEVLRAHVERIEAVNPKINAIVTMVGDAAEQAEAAERAVMRGKPIGPLHGVPFTTKDCVDTAGVRTTRGSLLFKDRVPDADAPVIARLKSAGGVSMAKTNMPEFALSWESENRVFGRTVNPWNFERTPGGSRGGEAAALAAGMSPLGVGSDVGGSIRGPAHHCGVGGLKATHGRTPLTGHWPEAILRAMHVGPMARSVRDIALALEIMAGPDGADPYALPVTVGDVRRLDLPISHLRIGWHAGHAFGPVDPEVQQVVAKAATTLAESGCQVEEVQLPALEKWDATSPMTLLKAEGDLCMESLVSGREAELSSNILRILNLPTPSLQEYLDARREIDDLKQGVARYFDSYDLLICPTLPVPAHPHDVMDLQIAGETVAAWLASRSNRTWDWTGLPGISVPFGWSSEGLPIGVQVVGRHYDEATVLRAAASLESTHDAGTRRPDMSGFPTN